MWTRETVDHAVGGGLTPSNERLHPGAIDSHSIDISPAFIRSVGEHLPNAAITFDKFHFVAQASQAVNKTRRSEQRHTPELKGMRCKPLRDPDRLSADGRGEIDALVSQLTTLRTARAWQYREQLRQIFQRKQTTLVRRLLSNGAPMSCARRSRL